MFARLRALPPSRLYLVQCVAFLVALGIVFSAFSPFFLSVENLGNVLAASAVIGVMALGATFVIASGAIDLSAASAMALAGVCGAWAAQKYAFFPLAAAGVAVGVGGLSGLITGWLVNVTRAPSFIITLGMLSIDRALAFILTGGVPIYGLDDRLTAFGQGRWFGVPIPAFVFLAMTAVAAFLLARTRFGLHTLLVGDNPGASEAMGVRVARLRLGVFGLAGLFSGLAGFLFMARTNSGDPAAGQNYELMAITAAILGGANLFGGRAAIGGTLAGVLCLGVLQNGLNLLALGTFYQILFVGIVLILAASLRRIGRNG